MAAYRRKGEDNALGESVSSFDLICQSKSCFLHWSIREIISFFIGQHHWRMLYRMWVRRSWKLSEIIPKYSSMYWLQILLIEKLWCSPHPPAPLPHAGDQLSCFEKLEDIVIMEKGGIHKSCMGRLIGVSRF